MTSHLLVLLVLSWISTLTRGQCSNNCRAPSGVTSPFSEQAKAELNGRCIAACGEEVCKSRTEYRTLVLLRLYDSL